MIRNTLRLNKRLVLLFGLIFAFNNVFGQISFEKAHYIDNNNNRIDGYIKNVDWESNPTAFEFKSTIDAQSINLTIESVSSFAIENGAKYIRSTVMMDRGGHAIGQLSKERNPEFNEETVLLKVLVEGEYVLYEFVDKSLRRFFYAKKGSKPEQLVYKRYNIDDYRIGTNQLYKQQIRNNINCEIITVKRLKNLNYERNALKKLFIAINGCFGDVTIVEYDKGKTVFNFYLKPGLSTNSFQTAMDEVYKVDGLIGYRLGVELEFVFPFNKNKWAAVVEPNYRTVSNETKVSNGTDIAVDFSSLEFPIGIRHYFFVSDRSKVFLEGFTNIEFGLKPVITVGTEEFEGKAESNFSLGGGYNYNDLFSVGVRIETPQDILSNFVAIEGKFWSASLLIGVKL